MTEKEKKEKINNQNINEAEEKNKDIYSKLEEIIDKNRKSITYIALGVIGLILGYFIYRNSYLKPLENEAQNEMYMAEIYFANDSFKLALYGDGQYSGFLKIIEDYGSTKAGNLAYYYAGICFLNLNNFEEAISYLKKFKTNDVMLYSTCNGAIGDAYLELGQYEKAINYYKKAAYKYPNQLTSPFYLMKLSFAYEKLGEWENALETYEYIKKNYSKTSEGRKVDKYISRAKFMINQKK